MKKTRAESDPKELEPEDMSVDELKTFAKNLYKELKKMEESEDFGVYNKDYMDKERQLSKTVSIIEKMTGERYKVDGDTEETAE